ncbi:unnamed protein product [Scytosiphon promiscuus]
MAMAPKAEIPLYHQSRLGGRPITTRRRRSSNGGSSKARRGGSSGRCWSVLLVAPLVAVAFCLGTFLGIELAQSPGGNGTALHTGASAPGGKYMPRLEHPKQPGWEWNNDNKRPDPPSRSPPPGQHLPGAVHDRIRGDRTKAHGSKPAHGAAGGGAGGGGEDVAGGSVPWLQEHSFHARQGAYVSLKEKSLDTSQEVTAAAWVLVDRDMSDIKTVLGNKMSGCGSDALGFALYVNEWNKKDGQLWLEWGDGAIGCQKLHSDVKVPVGRWVHLAAKFDSDGEDGSGRVSIYMDGDLMASQEGSRRPGSREEFAIGAFANGDFPFDGRIGAVTVFRTALEDTQIQDLAKKSATSSIGDTLNEWPLAGELSNVLVALQLDETWQKEKDGAVAVPAAGAADIDSGVYHFMHMQEPPKVDEKLKDGITTFEVTHEMREESDRLGRERAVKVKEAMQHAWRGYEQYAWGADELAPRGKKPKQSWGGMGVTLVDSLDTLWLMGMKDEFWKARDWVKKDLTFSHASDVSVFETTIRELGGLLSAYDLSGDEVFKTKAKELADLLLPAFDTKSGIPTPRVNFKTGRNSGGSKSVLAEIGTLQVEFRYLSKITGIQKYADKVNRVFDIMEGVKSHDGLYPIFINPSTAKPVGSQVTFGALGDSFYEYLLKVWLQGGKTEPQYREMYDRAMDGMDHVLLKKSQPSGLTYVSDWNGHSNVAKMDHLVCFLAGTLALGAQTAENPETRERDMKTAKALAYTCYQMYERQKTGLAPEMVNFERGKDMVVPPKAAYNILRPETAEALYVLHQLTGDPIYRDWSWKIFQAFDKHCRLPVAFGSFPNVNDPKAQPEDRMESFFLAETLKYLYLIQDPDQKVDLTKYVFNTEAHPLRMFDEMDRQEQQHLQQQRDPNLRGGDGKVEKKPWYVA